MPKDLDVKRPVAACPAVSTQINSLQQDLAVCVDPRNNPSMASTPPLRSAIQQDEALWVAHFTELYRQCHAGTGGCGLDDLDYLATIATGEVERVPQASRPDVSHFEHTPARQAFIAEIYQRQIRAYFSENYDAELFTRNDFTWAFLQVADMSKIAAWHHEISEDKEAVPGIFSQAEAMAQIVAVQFKFCKSHEEHRSFQGLFQCSDLQRLSLSCGQDQEGEGRNASRGDIGPRSHQEGKF